MLTNLLVPLDHSAIAEQALGIAAAIARACHASVDVALVSQPDPLAILDDEPVAVEAQWRQDALYVRDVARELAGRAFIPTTYAALRGDVVSGIVARAHAIRADLIVMTSHGRTGLCRAWLGSVADGLIRTAGTPVLMVRPEATPIPPFAPRALYRRILVPLDESVEAREMLRATRSLARCSNARIVLLRVVRPVPMIAADASLALVYPSLLRDEVATAHLVDEARQAIADVAHGLAKDGLEVEHHVAVAERIAHTVLDFAHAHAVDLIAMSTVGRGTSRLVIGSLADRIVRGSELPVLFYTPANAGFRTLIDAVREAEMSPAVPS